MDERGLKFEGGRPCKRCGGTIRYVSNGGCITCANATSYHRREVERTSRQAAFENVSTAVDYDNDCAPD